MEPVPANSSLSLAILPFENLTSDTEYEYFSKGLVEELIVDLSHFSDLQIISSYTSSRLSGGDVDEIEAARKIEIDYLLKGTLQFPMDTLRLNTQLIDTKTRKIIWAERFDVQKDSIFELQDSIVNRVVFKISDEVDHNLLAVAREKPVTCLDAYDCWLRGMDCLGQGTLEADHKAREFFNQALSIDSNYSRAYAGLSLSHFNEWSCQLWELYEQSHQNAYDYAVQAYKLNESDHIVQMILGRIYLYRRQFDQAEHHIEKSLELNRNDADNLVQLASCLSFLGRAAEGERLFASALELNPYRNLWYYQYGSLAYFVQRQFKTSIEMALKRQLTNVWVDLPAYIAAAYAHLGEKESALNYLHVFLESFTHSITKGRRPSTREITDWLSQANPFKYSEDCDCLIDGIKIGGLEEIVGSQGKTPINPSTRPQFNTPSIFKKEQAIWRFEFEGVETTMPDLKGFHDITTLLANPEKNIHCTELMGAASSMDDKSFVIDDKALAEYRRHINELQLEIQDAEEANDIGRKAKLQEELEKILEHLSLNTGLGKRPRKLNATDERARAAVTLRIRSVIKKIAEKNPALARHLSNSIRTGIFCCYSPEEHREWILH